MGEEGISERGRMEDPRPIILFSYFPLITEKMAETSLKHSQVPTADVLALVREVLAEGEELACARACIWLLLEGQLAPMLLISKAKRVHADLMAWTESKPEDWFTIQFAEEDDAYAVALFPDVARSVKRHGVAHLIQEEEFLQDSRYQVVMAPLHFVSAPRSRTYAQVKDQIGDSLTVYLYDIDNIDTGNPDIQGQIDEDLMLEVGRLKVSSSAKSYLRGLIGSVGEK